MSSHDWPRLGDIAVDPAALIEPGRPLRDVLAERGVPGDVVTGDLPLHGWRELASVPPGAAPPTTAVLGSPADGDPARWWVGTVSRGSRDGSHAWGAHHEPLPLRPSVAERTHGLVLRWAGPTASAPDVDHLAVDVVNEGSDRWSPQEGESFVALGFLRPIDANPTGFAFGYASGGTTTVPLDPGEYSRVPVAIGAQEWRGMAPGRVHVHALVPRLALRTEAPLEVELSEDVVFRHRSADGSQRGRGDAMLRRRLTGTSALLAARAELPRLVDEVLSAASDDDAVARVAAVLGCDDESARMVAHAGLVQYRSAERIEREVADLRRRLADPA
ncbi:hypothetical protein ACQFYA_04590 [Promicromonospora sp. Marseille-Q5078]